MQMESRSADKKAMKIVAIVGMAGSGKSEVARAFERHGFKKVRFGDITDEELGRRGFEMNEENERRVRQQLREERGMAAYAELNLPRIDSALQSSNVVVDGLYSWEEYAMLKGYYGRQLTTVAVHSSPATRYRRLARRAIRPLTKKEAAGRDKSELENLNKGGPIAMADFTIVNEASLAHLEEETERVLLALK